MISTPDQVLWAIIRNRTNAIGFQNYRTFMDDIMCGDQLANQTRHVRAPTTVFRGVDAYELLRVATDAFLMHEVGVVDANGTVKKGYQGQGDLAAGRQHASTASSRSRTIPHSTGPSGPRMISGSGFAASACRSSSSCGSSTTSHSTAN